MRFVSYGQDKWYHLPKLSDPDKKEKEFLLGFGEFSIYRDESFEKHIKKYLELLKRFAYPNGNKFKKILSEENFWYGKQGMERIIYAR